MSATVAAGGLPRFLDRGAGGVAQILKRVRDRTASRASLTPWAPSCNCPSVRVIAKQY